MTIDRKRRPTTLTAVGVTAPGKLALRVAIDAVWLGPLKLPGRDAAAVIDGPFLYLRAASSVSVNGFTWLRAPLSSFRQNGPALSSVRAFTPSPLLRVLAESRARPTGTPGVYCGPVAYDDPIVRAALRHLLGNVEFRGLVVTAWVGRDGFIHRIELDGTTADHSTTLTLRARLYGFGRPVSVSPPRPWTFMDKQLFDLDE